MTREGATRDVRILTHPEPRLAQPSAPVAPDDPDIDSDSRALHDALEAFRREHGFGRAISAPQIGIAKRFIAMNLGADPFDLRNPEITWRSEETHEVWDDCMSFPDTIVRVRRHRSISVRFEDQHGRMRHYQTLPTDLAELLQHEIDHLDGVLMIDRAVGSDAIRPASERAALVEGARVQRRIAVEDIPLADD